MLRMLRHGAKSPVTKFFLFGLMTMAVAGLVFMDVQGVFRNGVAPTDVAKIGDSQITVQQFNGIVRRAMQQQRMSETEAYKLGVINKILDQEIQSRLLSRETIHQGLYVGDTAAAMQLDKVLENIMKNMNIDKATALSLLLQQQHMSEAQLLGTMKNQLSSGLLLDGVMAGARAPQQLINDFAKFRNEKRSGRYVLINEKTAGKPDEPTEDELKQYYQKIAPERFALPEYRKLDVAVLTPQSVAGSVNLTDDDVRAEYENRLDEYQVPEQWSIAQAIVSDAATAQKIADLAQKGDTLKEATKKVLGDTIAYITPNLFTESALPDELRDTVVNMKVNEVSKPVESPLGWHVVKLDKKIAPYEKSFEEVKDYLHDEMMLDLAGDSLYDLTIQFDDMIAGGATVQDAAKDLNVKVVSLDPVDINGTKQDGDKADIKEDGFGDLLKEAFDISEGETTQLMQSGQSDYIAAGVISVIPATLKPFEEVKDKVREAWMEKEERVRASKLAGQLIERIRAGETLDKVAAEKGLKISSVKEATRTPSGDANYPTGLEAAMFNIDKIGAVENLISGNEAIIVELDDINFDIAADDAKREVTALTQVANQLVRQDRMSLYRMALYEKFDVKINQEALEQMFAQDQ